MKTFDSPILNCLQWPWQIWREVPGDSKASLSTRAHTHTHTRIHTIIQYAFRVVTDNCEKYLRIAGANTKAYCLYLKLCYLYNYLALFYLAFIYVHCTWLYFWLNIYFKTFSIQVSRNYLNPQLLHNWQKWFKKIMT